MSRNAKALISALVFIFLLCCIVIGALSQEFKNEYVKDSVYCQIHGHIDNKILRGRYDRVYFSKQQFDSCYTMKRATKKEVIVIRPNCRPRKFKCIVCGQKIIINQRDTLFLRENEYYLPL